jgi:glycosyltransferase involved in cell wall biosynthesis
MSSEHRRVTVPAAGQFHAFHRARQLRRLGAFERLLTTDPRVLLQQRIPPPRVRVFAHPEAAAQAGIRLAPARPWAHRKSRLHARTARHFLGDPNVVVAWSGRARETLKSGRRRGATVLERGSTHLQHQDLVPREEFERWGNATAPILADTISTELEEYALSELIVVPSSFARRTFLAHGVDPQRIVQIPYGAALSMFHPGPPVDDVFRVVFTGGTALRKSVPYLLEAWEKLALPNAELLLVGRIWPEMKPILARYEGLFRAVGGLPRPEVARLLRTSSVFAFSSLEEGLSLSLLEALASGLPVVATDASGVEDVLDEGCEGLLVRPRDVDGLAAALERLYREPDLRRHMAQRTAARARERTWDAYGDAVVRAYGHALARRAGKNA